jgi:hypothetical protein
MFKARRVAAVWWLPDIWWCAGIGVPLIRPRQEPKVLQNSRLQELEAGPVELNVLQ